MLVTRILQHPKEPPFRLVPQGFGFGHSWRHVLLLLLPGLQERYTLDSPCVQEHDGNITLGSYAN